MAEGPIKWFEDGKGYGFMEADEGRDVLLRVKKP